MARQNIKFWGLLALATSPIIVTFSGVQLVQAQSTAELLISVEFPSGPQRASSGRTRGGGTRAPESYCTPGQTKLTALMPGDNVGTTVADHPKFFVYVPEHKAESAEFEVFDKSGKSIYLTKLDISETSGIVKLALPKNVSLTTNKEYTWRFAMICDEWDHSANESVEGIVKKVEISSDLENSLKNASPLEQAEIYAKAKIWNETIATVAELRNSYPTEWEELLTSVGLHEIASEPFAPCCQVEE
ncbi:MULTISPECIES: DUF928 domain-containing protein [Okeania]|uniref:DUF928 domain-containing protein n=1 Tax=Okeania hirsuta TaxID=1458930 RepID=A0A3N6QH05_9CYAN|nr:MULTISPECIES: DUF928 domain-containing protein [Okeania]NES76360.1 DUF928 domain-containing protein [Okeania sp. SIO1H4]NES90737.1 DUF928 domain-containing protein [Okeania sp. SIO2B9]NET19807.1 DUF928 domain-containing protein [Okeania sp. SIO1H5]NET77727.1 DUF928 domain-containing protein [Okeania sp. SIO1F9]NET94090.1 DUF928 domain-containing protein [Okeania sp. SIO1H2]